MLKQLLTGGSVLALLLTGSFSAQAKPQEPILQSQVQEAPSTTPDATTIPDAGTTPDATTTPESDNSTNSESSDSNTALCSANPVASPTGGGSRQRLLAGLEAGESCN